MRERALKSLSNLPPFSPILSRLVASLAQEDVSFTKLADLIEKDTVVAASILHLVNSSLYARRGTVNSVRHALSILGFTKVRNTVLGMSVAKMWNSVRTPASWSMARFNMHSAATAILGDLLAQQLDVDYAEGAFIGGLLHDAGRLLIALGLGEEYERIIRMQQDKIHHVDGEQNRPLSECEMAVLGFTHTELSMKALEFWNLPSQVLIAVRDHHVIHAKAQSKTVSLSHIISCADQYVHCAGISVLNQDDLMVQHPLQIEELPLGPERLESVLTNFKAEHEHMAQFYK